MSKIEEAWAARPQDVYYESYGDLANCAEEDVEDWGRAAMLAVLDEAQSAAIGGFGRHRHASTEWNNAPLLELRRRIEELGK